jgi:hypothetical protein
MAKETDIKKKAEEVFGKDLAADMLERIRWTVQIASYNTLTDNTFVTSMFLVFPSKWCNPVPLFDIGGIAATGGNGQRVFRLREFSCVEHITFVDPINVVATPLSSLPFFLTVKHALVVPDPDYPGVNDVEITVFVWDANGKAAPNIAFDWRCRVPYNTWIL